jgi:hypothetical protein
MIDNMTLDLFSAAGDASGSQIATADVERIMVAPGHESAQTMAHSGSASGVSTQPPVWDRVDSALADLVAASDNMMSDKWRDASIELRAAVGAVFGRAIEARGRK